MQKVNIDGIEVAYERGGKGAPLVLLHGYPLDHTIWDEISPLLNDSFDLIIPDLRGFGGSDVMEADHSIVDYASDVAGLLDHLKIKKACLVGHSMGGYVALAFVREFPERVSGLGLLSSQTPADTNEKKTGRLATAKQVIDEGVGPVVESMTPKLSTDKRVQSYVRNLIAKQRPLGIANALRAMADRPDSTELFSTLKFPVLVMHGDADELIPVDLGRAMKASLPSTKYIEFKGLGHMAMMENPKAVAEAHQYFINS